MTATSGVLDATVPPPIIAVIVKGKPHIFVSYRLLRQFKADIKGHKLPDVGWPKRSGKFYVKVLLDGQSKQSAVSARGNVASWLQSFYFDARGSSLLELQVYAHHSIGRDEFIGGTKEDINSFLAEGVPGGVISRELCKHSANGDLHKTQAFVEFTITTSTNAVKEEMDKAVAQGMVAIGQMKYVPVSLEPVQGAVDLSTTIITNIKSNADTWDPLLQKLRLFTEIVEKISEVHPYASMAWSILSASYKFILGQKDRDECIDRLVEVMDDVYSFVQESEPLNKIESHKQIIVVMAQQTTECAYFIRDYAMNKNFWKRALKNGFMSDVDIKINQYQDKFKELKMIFQGRAVLQTGITVSRIFDNLESLTADFDLSDMPYADGARFDPEKGCMPGTRENIMAEIIQWVNTPDSDTSRIFFLSGVAGSGKSAIAHAVARQFDPLKRLGSSYCFDRADQAKRHPRNLLSTIALDIADLDHQWKTSLRNVVKGNRSLRTTLAITDQFKNFILEPAKALTTIGPVLVVIDALDESGEPPFRKALLDVLAKKVSDFPPNFRVLITARPEPDILDALSGGRHVLFKYMDTIDKTSNEADISLFIQAQLSDVPSLEIEWPNKQWCRMLLKSSDGLFQWASTACRAIKGGRHGLRPTERLTRFVSSARGLDGLYSEVLRQTFDVDDITVMSRFKLIMGRILAAKEPLSISAHAELCCDDDLADLIELIMQPLGSLMRGVNQPHVPIRALHASFFDFLTEESRSNAYHVDPSQHNGALALSSLQVMKVRLRFNICDLTTSYIRNTGVPDLAERIEKAIRPYLSYSCRFWADHLQATTYDSMIQEELRDFMYSRFLFWLEVLSLIDQVNLASRALTVVINVVGAHSQDLEMAMDMGKFVAAFARVISQSAPHIYLSALPFAPKKSIVSTQYLSHYAHTLSVQTGGESDWPAIQNVMVGHTDVINTIAFSPNGKHIVSGSDDATIRVWDAETGEVVVGPLEWQVRGVSSVAFSPDSKRIVAGAWDTTIRVWDAERGEVNAGLFEGHTEGITSVEFSPDGKRIVSGAWDKTIRVWDAETGEIVLGPLEGHTDLVHGVMFSPDGRSIVSCSKDKSIRVWDAETGQVVAGPLEGHTHKVTSVAFSPDGKRIVSSCDGGTIRLWDAKAGEIVVGPFKGHSAAGVKCVAFSPDGKHIVSGSWDKTIWVWDSETGEIIAGPLEGHTDCINSVAFSPDGKRIISGSGDKTIRVWDAELVKVAARSLDVHIKEISSVMFSPDGKRIVSGSDDTLIRVWDAETGEVVAGSFEGHTKSIVSVIFSPDGKRIVSGSADKTIRVWDAQTGDLITGPLKGHSDTVNSVAFSPDGKHIVSGSDDMSIRVWDVETGEVVSGPLEGHEATVRSVAFSPDGKRIVSGSGDMTLRVWNAETGNVVAGPFEGHISEVFSVAFSPDGKHIASGSWDNTIRVWNPETGQVLVGPLEGHTDEVCSIAFSPDGKHIVSGSGDKTIIMWDATTGKVVAGPLEGHTNWINSVMFSPDGKHIVSGAFDKTIRVWDAETSEGIARLEGRLETIRPLTDAQLTDKKMCCFTDSSKLDDGWILGSNMELLFWVPHSIREGLWRPRNTAVMAKVSTKLDLKAFVHGDAWVCCCK